ncbi:DNA-processing protein DprA [Marinomonas hwangdonensis]|nr:DNA-processing protein DprA [Marinomonas hwangdonensis]
MSDLSALHALAMEKSKGLKKDTVREVVKNTPYGSISDLKELKEFALASFDASYFPNEKAWNESFRILELSEKESIHCISIESALYPKYLKEIDDAPTMLYLKGDLKCLSKLPGVSVVGSRKVSKNGGVIANRIANFVAEQGLVVVSGLALGVDTLAHKGALMSGRQHSTIAVLAHGLEVAKPLSNAKLAEEIINNGGLWVSEHHIGVEAKPYQFVARNRIQLGLSAGSIIIEAGLSSGTVTQAKFCVKQGRPLFAVVPEDDTNRLGLFCEGTQMMVKDLNAFPLKNKKDYPEMIRILNRQVEMMKLV